jgi:hypothetical protein
MPGPPSPYGDRVELVLRAMPGTVDELALRCGTPRRTMEFWTLQLRRYGWAHVATWKEPTGAGRWHPVLSAGPGKNKPTPARKTPTERARKCWLRMKEDGRYDRYLSRKRVVDKIKQIRQQGRKATPFDALMP